jgi:hypothetical protein
MCVCARCAGIDYAAIHLWPDNWKRVRTCLRPSSVPFCLSRFQGVGGKHQCL